MGEQFTDVRSPIYGTPAVFVGDTFINVDSAYFTKNDARVVCRELGYNFSKILQRGFFQYGSVRLGICISKLNCTGTESNVYECGSSYVNCSYNEIVGAAVCCSIAFINDSKHCYVLFVHFVLQFAQLDTSLTNNI